MKKVSNDGVNGIKMTPYEKAYWDERSSEYMRGQLVVGPEIDEYKKTHPLPSRDAIINLLKQYESELA